MDGAWPCTMVDSKVQPGETEGLPITSPASPGLFSSRGGLWRESCPSWHWTRWWPQGAAQQSLGHEREPHGTRARKLLGQSSESKCNIARLNMKGWTFLQALPIPFRAITLWFQRECRRTAALSAARGIRANSSFDRGEATPPWAALALVALCSWHVLLIPSCARLTRCHPALPRHSS